MSGNKRASTSNSQSDSEPAEGSTSKAAKTTARSGQDRKEQNRKAQRAFRDRKAAYIKELETQVAELRSNANEARYDGMREMVRVLSKENEQLRLVVRELGACVGEGVGSALPRIGMTLQEYDALLDRPAPIVVQSYPQDDQSRSSRHDSIGPPPSWGGSDHHAGPSSPPHHAYNLASSSSRPPNPVDEYLPPIIARRPSVTVASGSAEAGPIPSSYSHSHAHSSTSPYPPMLNSNLRSTSRSAAHYPPSTHPSLDQHVNAEPAPLSPPIPSVRPRRPDESTEDYFTSLSVRYRPSGKEGEALELIRYHLSNSRSNPHYYLPPCLRPSELQRTTLHDPIIDSIPIPSLRVQLIKAQGSYDINQLFPVICSSLRIHGQDVLNSSAWELDEALFTAFPTLATPEVLAHSDQWRISRGEQPLAVKLGIAGEGVKAA